MSFLDPTPASLLTHQTLSEDFELGCWPMMTQEHGPAPRAAKTRVHMARLEKARETLGEGILHEMTWLLVLPPGPRE